MFPLISSVPAPYHGVWRRTGIFRSDGRVDLTTSVWWFQSARFHIDLRVPLDRPKVSTAQALASLTAAQLQRYSAQSAFAGITVVQNARCEWRPEIAFPAISADIDAGLMRFDTRNNLHESGLDASYEEDWLRVAPGPIHGARLSSLDVPGKVAYLIISGDHAAWACGHAQDQFPATQGSAFSLLRRTHAGAPWHIHASNHGWLENSAPHNLPAIAHCRQGEILTLALPASEQWYIEEIT